MLLVLINCDRPAVNRRKCTISLATITLQRIFENSVYEHVCYLVGKVYMTAFNFIWPNKISFLSRAEHSSKLFSFDFKLLCSTQSSLQTQKHIEMHKLANTHTHTVPNALFIYVFIAYGCGKRGAEGVREVAGNHVFEQVGDDHRV